MKRSNILMHITVQIFKGRQKKYNNTSMLPQQEIFADEIELIVNKDMTDTHLNL